MTTNTFGYDVQQAAWTYNGAEIRREGITDGSWKFRGDKFIWVTETRSIAQIVEELTAGVVIEDEDAAVVEEIMHGEEVQQ